MSLYDSLIAMQAQINDLRAQLNNISRVDRPSIDGDSFVHLTGDETVAGIKTFTSIPVLPASDPTSDNQAVRKKYVTDLVGGLTLGKIIAVKSAVFTGTQSSSVASGGNVAITDLSISHACEKSTNKIYLIGRVGVISDSSEFASAGIALAVDGSLVGIGDASSNRIRLGANLSYPHSASWAASSLMVDYLYSPGTISSKTYTLRALNVYGSTITVYINCQKRDTDAAYTPRGSSSITLLEVAA